MKILTEEEMNAQGFIKQGPSSLLRKTLLQLKPGQGLFLANEEWAGKNPPYHVVRRVARQTGWKFEYGKRADGTGWQFQRTA